MLPGVVAGLVLAAAGCGKSDNVTLSCHLSAQDACPMSLLFPCDSSWAEAQADVRLCLPGGAGAGRSTEYDCGGYHVIHEVSVGGGLDVYYDATSGSLVALVGSSNGALSCWGGPPTFVLPAGCTNPASAPPPPQCRPDAGAGDGARG